MTAQQASQPPPNEAPRYPRPLQVLHWGFALLVSVQIVLILVLRQMHSLEFGQLVLSLHRQCGALVLILVLVRIAVAFRYRGPGSPPNSPAWQTAAAHLVHFALLAVLVLQPVLGFLQAWSRGDDVVLFGLLKTPALVQLTHEQGLRVGDYHRWTSYALLGLVAVHLGAVVFNRVVRRTTVLERMMPSRPADRLVDRVPLPVQLGMVCGVILAMTTAAGLYGAYQYKTFNTLRTQFAETTLAPMDELRAAQLELKGLGPRLVGERAPDASDAAADLAGVIGDVGQRLSDADARAAAAAAQTALKKAAVAGDPVAQFTEAEAQVQAAVDGQAAAVFQGNLEIEQIGAKGHDLIILTLAPTLLVAAVLAFVLARSILSALRQARTVVRSVAEAADVGALRVEGRGDIAELMREILAMRAAVETREHASAAQQLAQRAEMERLAQERREVEAEASRQHAADQAVVVGAVAQGLSALARGELAFRLNTAFPAGYEQLRVDFNNAIAELDAALETIAAATHGIDSNSEGVSAAVEELSSRTERQAANLEETAAALEEVTGAVSRSANSMKRAGQVVAAARTEADLSNNIVEDAIRAMGDIEASSDRIGEIVGLIDEIAFQTNLLALNAGVEAARAGDSGRGFAVVAQEVRALAQRSADAAKDIKALISDSRRQVARGVGLVGRTGEALQKINGEVGQIDSLVTDIAETTRGQALSLEEVNRAMGQIERITQQNAAMVEETTATVSEMVHDIRRLDTLMSRFSVSGSQPAVGRLAKVVLRRAS